MAGRRGPARPTTSDLPRSGRCHVDRDSPSRTDDIHLVIIIRKTFCRRAASHYIVTS